MRILKEEQGQVLVMTVLSMTVLMGFMALALDVGVLYNARRRVQTTADASAIAGAISYRTSGSMTTAAQAATTAAGNNGMPPTNSVSPNTACTDLTKNCLEVYFGTHITNAYHNTSGYVETMVSQPNPTIFINTFMAMFNGSSASNFPVTAKGVAGIVPSAACTTITDPTDASTLWVSGGGAINSSTCGIVVDSTSKDALCVQGSGTHGVASKIDAPYVNIVGGQPSGGKCGKSAGSPTYSNSLAANDPFNNNTGPNPKDPTVCTAANTFPLTSYTADPGKYVTVTTGSGASATTAQVECFTGTNVQISGNWGSSPSTNGDIFIFENGVTISGTTTINGTLDIYSGSLTQGNSALTVNAPGSDNARSALGLTYDTIAIMQPSENLTGTCTDSSATRALVSSKEPCLQLQFGSGSGTLNGYVYAPTSEVYMQDNGGSPQVAGIVAYSMFVNSVLNITNFNEANPLATPLTTIELVE